MKHVLYFVGICLLFSCSQPATEQISIIPAPAHLNVSGGEFVLDSKTQLIFSEADGFQNEIDFFQLYISEKLGKELSIIDGRNSLEILKSNEIEGEESYSLIIQEHKITLKASHGKGIFYGLMSLKQLIPPSNSLEEIRLPVLEISDQPTYEWRGMHLDVSRHFFSMDYLKRYVDLLALYKLNKLHLHLTDDQGWRIEIKKYPQLTEQGAWRTFNDQDSICIDKSIEDPRFALDPKHIKVIDDRLHYGGYYTQEELKDLVAFAGTRHVEIIPEIDMPGHMMAAISVFPELACNGEAAWGEVFSTPLCPVNEEVYTFVENVLTEVSEIFPSKYIHIGADEVEKSTWEESSECNEFMRENGIEDVDLLQSYFVERVTTFLQDKGKEVVVWDDALAGGIDASLNVMYWRNWVAEVPDKVVKNGNDLILTPGDPFYFSSPNSKLFDIYNKKLLGAKFPEELSYKIKGLQACLWTETIPSEELADAMLFPNVLALAERAWSPSSIQDWDAFKRRLPSQLDILESMGVKYEYKQSNALIPFMNVDLENKRIGVSFETDLNDPIIYYTTDGTIPTSAANLYQGEFFVNGSASIVAAVFEDGEAKEPILKKQVDYHLAIGKPVVYNKAWNPSYPAGDAGSLTNGLRGGDSYNDGFWQGFTNDLDVIVDLEEVNDLSYFSANFMQLIGPGVFLPGSLEVSISEDGKTFEKVLTLNHTISSEEEGLIFHNFEGSLEGKSARFVQVNAKNTQSGFMFVDELVIK
ncbi:family 20 glycosylhydrolase [Algoriphagus lutimaris]|uniref:glycoside hydrolase family 20 protein n=1 Tax=Algoriphagus lutimaris TaxID=613197 RepID=UPI00196A8655|nr:family 20 glycosylhydrolase [Algoriphagus lutimaris]MBN3518788.1 family 20 glycosylhydrolase [Algoriphagus lutimaris]